MLARVKIGFKGLSVPVKIEFATKIRLKMDGNTNFTDPTPTMEELATATTALSDASQAASGGGTSKTATLRLKEGELDDVITNTAAFVQSKSNGDAEIIRSSGFEVRSAPTPAGIPEQPEQLAAATSTYAGEVLLKWKPMKGINSYLIEKSNDGSTGWLTCGTSTKGSVSIGSLPGLTYVWFRVTAINAAGQSPSSAAVKALVA